MDHNEQEKALSQDLKDLIPQWQEYNIDPDDFVKCGVCHMYFVDEDGRDIDCECDKKKKEQA